MAKEGKGKSVITCAVVVVAVGILVVVVLVLLGFGRGLVGMVWRGNVYSVGHRDVYIQGTSEKPDTLTGMGRVFELKGSHHGFGSGVDPAKQGQTPQGAWTANYFEDAVHRKVLECRGDMMVRVFYIEKDMQFSGASNYEVLDVMELPPPGEPMDALIEREIDLRKEHLGKE